MGLFKDASGALKPWVSVAGNIGGAILGVGQSVGQYRVQKEQQRKQREHERAMAEYAYNRDVDMWNMANEYNTPLAQMQRFKEAGLNPNMIYGNKTGVTGNTVAQMPKYNPPRQQFSAQFPNVAQNIQAYTNVALRQAQIDNVKANTDLTNQKKATEAFNTEIREQENRWSGMFYHNRASKMNWDAKSANLKYDLLNETLDEQIRTINSDNKYKRWLNKAKRNGLNPETDPVAARLTYLTAIRQNQDPYNWMLSYAVYQEAASWLKSFLAVKQSFKQNPQRGRSQNTIQKKYNPNKFPDDGRVNRIDNFNAQKGF